MILDSLGEKFYPLNFTQIKREMEQYQYFWLLSELFIKINKL